MELAPIPIQSGNPSRGHVARAQALAQVKFMGLPLQGEPDAAPWGRPAPGRGSPVSRFISRVIGRLVAARP
ncbi:MAG TPA: hypothetical protein VLT60_01155 [Usitatibacter sp.]|nr:hypothetical protein [Usitatibacter sp.]